MGLNTVLRYRAACDQLKAFLFTTVYWLRICGLSEFSALQMSLLLLLLLSDRPILFLSFDLSAEGLGRLFTTNDMISMIFSVSHCGLILSGYSTCLTTRGIFLYSATLRKMILLTVSSAACSRRTKRYVLDLGKTDPVTINQTRTDFSSVENWTVHISECLTVFSTFKRLCLSQCLRRCRTTQQLFCFSYSRWR